MDPTPAHPFHVHPPQVGTWSSCAPYLPMGRSTQPWYRPPHHDLRNLPKPHSKVSIVISTISHGQEGQTGWAPHPAQPFHVCPPCPPSGQCHIHEVACLADHPKSCRNPPALAATRTPLPRHSSCPVIVYCIQSIIACGQSTPDVGQCGIVKFSVNSLVTGLGLMSTPLGGLVVPPSCAIPIHLSRPMWPPPTSQSPNWSLALGSGWGDHEFLVA